MKNNGVRFITLLGLTATLFFFQNCSNYDGAVPSTGGTKTTTTTTSMPNVQYCAANVGLSGAACQNKGAGVIVTLTGLPADVQNKISGCKISLGWFGASGNGLYVDWGDGNTLPKYSEPERGESCTDAVQYHAYPGPGVYTVKIVSWHPGPTDMPITDWQKTITVVINN